MRIVLDTNVLVSALITKGTPPDLLYHAWDALLETIDAAALVVEGLPDIDLSSDPDDNVILATAIAGKADMLATGDKSGLLELKAVHGIPIVTPRTALKRIQGAP